MCVFSYLSLAQYLWTRFGTPHDLSTTKYEIPQVIIPPPRELDRSSRCLSVNISTPVSCMSSLFLRADKYSTIISQSSSIKPIFMYNTTVRLNTTLSNGDTHDLKD